MEEKHQCESEEIDKISKEEMEAAAACGLKPIRQYGDKKYELAGVALKDDTKKCQALVEFAQLLKMQGIPCKLEEKAKVIAVYIRVS